MDNSDVGMKDKSMQDDRQSDKTKKCRLPKRSYGSHHSGAIYGMGFIGAAIYYISGAGTFWMGVVGIIKAVFWPAAVVYGLLKYLGM